jgi:hypothetical protein
VNRIREWIRTAARPDAKSRPTQLFEMIRLAGSGRYSPGEYWVYGFYRKEIGLLDMLEFMPSQLHYRKHLAALVRPVAIPIMENKWLFHLHLASQAIPLPECYGVFDPSFGFTSTGRALRSGEDLARLLASVGRPMIAKPVMGSQGRGVTILGPTTEDAGITSEKLAELSRTERGGGVLLQQKLEQHEELRDLSPTAAINLRVITIRRKTAESVISSASMRIGRVGATMSNASQGGLLGQVHTETGEITAARNGLYLGSELVESHPDTGVRIVGRTVPEWERIRQVCIAAAETLPGAASVGWDVILTPEGPKVLEANHDWDMISEQVFGTGYLARNRGLLREYGLEFPETKLPRWGPGNVLAFILR